MSKLTRSELEERYVEIRPEGLSMYEMEPLIIEALQAEAHKTSIKHLEEYLGN